MREGEEIVFERQQHRADHDAGQKQQILAARPWVTPNRLQERVEPLSFHGSFHARPKPHSRRRAPKEL